MFSNSLALISDALHNFSDFIALIISFVAVRVMRWDNNERKSYGYFRVEILAAFINATALVLIGVYIIYEAVSRLYSPEDIHSRLMIIIASIGFAANIISVFLIRPHRSESLNAKGAFLHLARAVCRRAERLLVALREEDVSVSTGAVRCVNRLSDALFVWSRWINAELDEPEHAWNPSTQPPEPISPS